MTNIGINGMGRIGRLCFRVLFQRPGMKVTAINDPSAQATIAHLLRYDSSHGQWKEPMQATPDGLLVGNNLIQVTHERGTGRFWQQAKVDILIECSGAFCTAERASMHIAQGVRCVVVSAPVTGDAIPTVVLGVNDHILTGRDRVISNASCTTNCLAVMAKVLDEHFGLKEGYVSTVHAYTADQQLLDKGHKDLRRARAAATSIVPTTTGAARTIGKILPHLDGKLDGISIRVPVQDGSLTDLVCLVEQAAEPSAVNQAFKKAAAGPLKGLLAYVEDPIVSVDIVGAPYSCLFDSLLTQTRGKMIKIVGWYDNEMGYTHRIVDLVERIIKLGV